MPGRGRPAALAVVALAAGLALTGTATVPTSTSTSTSTSGRAGTGNGTVVTDGAGLRPDSTPAPSCEDGQPVWITQAPWGLSRLGARDVWSRYTDGEGVVVAVVDSGVEAQNPHLDGVVMRGTSLTDNDVNPDGTTAIANHGTAIATIIAAQKVETSQLVGVAPGARILPVRYFQSSSTEAVNSGNGPTPARLAAGIIWAADHGAHIINVSSSQAVPDPALERAVRHAQGRGALVIASGGNDPYDEEVDGPRWPAAYPGVLGVTATTPTDEVTDLTIHSEAVDVAAPGQQIPVGMLAMKDCVVAAGASPPATSWATAYVSGAAALVWAAHPHETAEQVAYRLMASADRPRQGQRDDRRGWGVINALEAVTLTIDPSRPGPPVPGHESSDPVVAQSRVVINDLAPDPLTGPRVAALWWGLVTTAVLGLLLLLARWNRLTGAAGQGP